MDMSSQTCAMCGAKPAKFASLVPASHDHVRLSRPLCEVCVVALGQYLDQIVDRVAKATATSEVMFATARALEAEADRFVAQRSSAGITESVDSMLDALGVKYDG